MMPLVNRDGLLLEVLPSLPVQLEFVVGLALSLHDLAVALFEDLAGCQLDDLDVSHLLAVASGCDLLPDHYHSFKVFVVLDFLLDDVA